MSNASQEKQAHDSVKLFELFRRLPPKERGDFAARLNDRDKVGVSALQLLTGHAFRISTRENNDKAFEAELGDLARLGAGWAADRIHARSLQSALNQRKQNASKPKGKTRQCHEAIDAALKTGESIDAIYERTKDTPLFMVRKGPRFSSAKSMAEGYSHMKNRRHPDWFKD